MELAGRRASAIQRQADGAAAAGSPSGAAAADAASCADDLMDMMLEEDSGNGNRGQGQESNPKRML